MLWQRRLLSRSFGAPAQSLYDVWNDTRVNNFYFISGEYKIVLKNSVLDVLCNVEHSLFIENKYNGLLQLLVLIINFRM